MAVKKSFFLIPVVPLLMLGSVAALATTAKFRYVNPWAPDALILIDDGGPVLVEERVSGQPRAMVPQPLFDFGRMNPLTMGSHEFEIRNLGDAPLRLSDGGTSCKCTMAEIQQAVVAPGESTKVVVDFNTGRNLVYLQSATIKTNDPRAPRIKLQVRGEVEVQVAAEPRSVELGGVDPAGGPVGSRMLLYSRTRTGLTVLGGEANLKGLSWKAVAASQADLERVEALSAMWIEVEVPPGQLPTGSFVGLLTLETEGVEPDGSLAPETVRVGVGGEVLRRFSVYGSTIDDRGVITLGNLVKGRGHSAKLLVKVRDQDTRLGVANIKVQPPFVNASLVAHDAPGLYVLELQVPQSAPVGDYSGSFAGRLTVEVEHPRIETQQFKLEFDVVERLR